MRRGVLDVVPDYGELVEPSLPGVGFIALSGVAVLNGLALVRLRRAGLDHQAPAA